MIIRSGIPHALPDGELSGVFRSPWASIQTIAMRSKPRREPLDGADVRAAAPAEDERPLGELRGERERLLAERVLVDDAASG